MARTTIQCTVIGDYIGASAGAGMVIIDTGDATLQLALAFSDDASAVRLANAIEFARYGPEHSVYSIAEAMLEAARFADALSRETVGATEYDVDEREIGGDVYPVRVLAHNFNAAAAAAIAAVADMDRTLAVLSTLEGGADPEAALAKCRDMAAASLRRARGPQRLGQLALFGEMPE
jgi:hypothetical protein